ncbi:MAG TPA: hypothetical protein VHA33_01785 [Candidatus Angelobacter sp.]|jgi:hypothetical protein|nr:hypothetical protein [Candidatus Angelobacter sp.]
MPVIVLSRILPLALQSLILVVMLRRKLRPEFPLFFQYALINSFVLCAAIILRASPVQQAWFPYADWAISLISMIFAFGVLYEVFINTLKPYSALMDLGRMLFRWTAVVVGVAALITVFATLSIFATDKRVASLSSFESVRLLVDHSVRLMQCGLLVLLLLFEKRLGLSWRSRGMAIALGLGSSAAVALAVSFLKGFIGSTAFKYDLDLLNGGFYVAVALFWAVCLMRPETRVSNVLQSPNRVIAQRWNEALVASRSGSGELTISPVDMFMPGIENVVDRVLARKIVN